MEIEIIKSKIHEIRGEKVMLDFDLAAMYQVETRVLKQAVRRNLKRFEGDDFMFVVTKEELSRSQYVTLNKGRGGNIKYLPFAFTELGVAMLSSVLNSDTAIEINRAIMRAFVSVRQLISMPMANKTTEPEKKVEQIAESIEEMFSDQNDINEDTRLQLELINQTLAEMQDKRTTDNRPYIGFRPPKED